MHTKISGPTILAWHPSWFLCTARLGFADGTTSGDGPIPVEGLILFGSQRTSEEESGGNSKVNNKGRLTAIVGIDTALIIMVGKEKHWL